MFINMQNDLDSAILISAVNHNQVFVGGRLRTFQAGDRHNFENPSQGMVVVSSGPASLIGRRHDPWREFEFATYQSNISLQLKKNPISN